ncbi:helix-turn-helix domain-containing protein [Pumilibacter muris]|jgi:transcriptional regulator with XRE-family HTH domain|uniref:helix-turn-helix domain-containing protein n=1 Tax=Pumilibacter muris TaxID=2941510 RepID=UPI00203D11B2|nr:helix-turn-helix transcriptional regulator [Pumilibacter muris]
MYGKIIKELRLEHNLTQKQLAENLGTTQKSISKYELELLDLSTEMLIRLCKFFDVSADYILGVSE